MKKLTATLLAVLMILSLTGCSLSDLLGRKDNQNGAPNYDSDGFSGSGSSGDYDDDYDYSYSGDLGLGDTARTYFFDFEVNDAYLTDELEDYYPESGYTLLVVDLTVENTFKSSIPMFDTDFQIQWGAGDDDYGWPINLDVEGVFPEQYDLDAGESRTESLVFAVPKDAEEYALAYQEEFDDGTTGDVYFVYFTADYAADAEPA